MFATVHGTDPSNSRRYKLEFAKDAGRRGLRCNGCSMPRLAADKHGSFVLGDFESVREVGRGTHGVISLVRHKRSGDEFVLKRLVRRRL